MFGNAVRPNCLHLRGMLYGRSSPGTHHSTVDDKPAAVYRHIRSTNTTPVQRPYHGHRTVPEEDLVSNQAFVLSNLATPGAFIY